MFTSISLAFNTKIHILISFSHGLVGQRKSDNKQEFTNPLVVVYYEIDYVKNPKGTNYWRNRVLKVNSNKDILSK